jgi:hypothetical protein
MVKRQRTIRTPQETAIFSFMCMICRSLFVLLLAIVLPVSFFNLRILITSLGSSSSSCLSCLSPMVFVLPNTFRLLGLPIFLTRRFNLIYKPGVKPISPSFVINQMNPKFNTHLCRGPWSWCPNISSSVESVDGRRCLVSYPMSKEAFCDVCLDRYPLDCVEDCLEYCFDISLTHLKILL